jgi:hypothetical protein
LDSQFSCGKCRKPITSKYDKCMECGYLGPHTFNTQMDSAIEGGLPTHTPSGKANYPAERIEKQSPPSRRESYSAPEPVDLPPEPFHESHEIENDSRFPAGMRRRSPILDDIVNIDQAGEQQPKKHHKEDADWDSRDTSQDYRHYSSYEDESEEKPIKKGSSSTVTTIISITLLLVLVVAAIYVINNYDELTKWLASPTIPEIFRPTE